MKDKTKVTFTDCVLLAARTKDIVSEFDRLTGSNLSFTGTGLDLMIDEATGRLEDNMIQFIEFVYECVWLRLPPEIRQSYSTGKDSNPCSQ